MKITSFWKKTTIGCGQEVRIFYLDRILWYFLNSLKCLEFCRVFRLAHLESTGLLIVREVHKVHGAGYFRRDAAYPQHRPVAGDNRHRFMGLLSLPSAEDELLVNFFSGF